MRRDNKINQFSVILDIDETILHCPHSNADHDPIRAAACGLKTLSVGTGQLVILRPGLFDFLIFLRKHFDDIYIYTAGTSDYANAVVEGLTAALPDFKLITNIFSRESCEIRDDYIRKKLPPHLDNQNTLVIDDRHDVTFSNLVARIDAGCQIHIKRFEISPDAYGSMESMCNDKVLADLILEIEIWKKKRM